MNIAAYCRVSTDKSDQLNSLEVQKKFFNEFTNKNNHTLVKIYADEGISGTKIKNRKEFLQLMRDADLGLFEMVVVKDISRFARNTVDLLNSTRQLKALNIETLFLTSNMTVLGNSEFVLTIFGALAQEESANISKRVKFGKKMNAEKGRVPNIVYGYDKTIGDYFNLKINEFEADVIRRIYDMYINQGYGAAKISTKLNQEGLKTKRKCNWSQNAVARILTNELYTGKIINGKQEVTDFLTGIRHNKNEKEWMVTERPDLCIIQPELFKQAKNILESRYNKFNLNRERQSNKYLFSTLIKCAECGYSFRRTKRTYKNTYIRWVCSCRNGKGAGSCSNKISIDEQELMDALRDYFAVILKQKKNIVQNIIMELIRIYKSREDNEIYDKELKGKIVILNKTRQKYFDMYTDDLISRKELRDKVGILNSKIEKLENELKLVANNLSKSGQLEKMLTQTYQTIEDVVSMETVTNAQLKQLIQKIVVDDKANCNIYLKLFRDMNWQHRSNYTQPYTKT